uniref:KRAB-related domain-containing protein n=1 Tax=Phocoena sinus TaxID=42100 RepID=A0A8C9EAU2_PHOSS
MNRGRSFEKSPREGSQKSEKNSKDISKYFSKKEWADLGYSEKITYVYMKRNYDIMTDLGNRKFCVGKRLCKRPVVTWEGGGISLSDKTGRREIYVWTHRLRERKNLVVYEEISDSKEDD